MLRLVAGDPGFDAALAALRVAAGESAPQVAAVVKDIIADVRARGDEALAELTRRFDRREIGSAADLEVSRGACESAWRRLPEALRDALGVAASRIEDFHRRQLRESWQYHDEHGNLLGQRIVALERVGVYVPGGKASYPSSVLMNALPARVAGVGEIIMAVPAPGAELSDAVLGAAHLAKIDRVFTIGGAQAIAALALGTASVPRVDKIVGPGNVYVAEAKRQLFGEVGIDMIAGPSEVVVICDGQTDPAWIALDLCSQAEHDELAQAILISPDGEFLLAVEQAIARLLPGMKRREVIARSLATRGALVKTVDLDEALAVANRIAPEHLELSVADPRALLPGVRHAGAVFLGRYTAEALGDYCAGPSHVLPTSGTARFFSPLGVDDFQKRISLVGCSEQGARVLGEVAAALAHAEGLQAHALSAMTRYRAGDAS